MTLAAWLAWFVVAVAVAANIITGVLHERRVTRIVDEVDNLNAVVFGAADDINVREAIVDLRAYVGELAAYVTAQDEPSTGRHAHSGIALAMHRYDPETGRCTCGALDHQDWGVTA